MTNTEFVSIVDQEKARAAHLLVSPGIYRVRRGMAKTISGYTEDVLAVYLASNLHRQDQRFFVEKVISYREESKSRAISIKPDVLIVNDQNVVTHYFDAKTNLGRLRYAGDYLAAKNDFIASLKSQRAWTEFGNEGRIDLSFSENLKYYMVVVFGWNINEAQKKENYDRVSELPNVELYHLQTQISRTERKINHEEFERLIADTRKNLLP